MTCKSNFEQLFNSNSGGGRGNRSNGTDNADTLLGSSRSDSLFARGGDDTLLDLGRDTGWRADVFSGGDGNDTIRTQWGRDMLLGDGGNDLLVSRSDAGEPIIAQNPGQARYNSGQPYSGRVSNDVLTGGDGADRFFFRMDLDARHDIVAKHVDEAGNIDWEGVAGENGAAHLHRVNSIGTDTITDFNRAQGDTIRIEGHTANIDVTYADRNRDGAVDSIINIKSNQGGAGSHNGDSLGQILVLGDKITAADVSVDAGVHHGAYGNINDMMIA